MNVIFRFAAFELDDEKNELRERGKPVRIQPKPLALLALLIRERERVVSADELFAELWPGTVVTPGSLTRAISHARRAVAQVRRAYGKLLERGGDRASGSALVDEALREAGDLRMVGLVSELESEREKTA